MTLRQAAHPTRLLALAALCSGLALTAGAADLDDGNLITLSAGAQPALACDIQRDGRTLTVTIEVAAFTPGGNDVEPTLGLAAAKQVILAAGDARATRGSRRARFTWSVPARDLVTQPADWKRLRLGIAVRWAGGPNGTDRRRERYRHIDGGAPGAGLSPRPEDWAPLDLDDLAQRLADRRDRLVIPLTQPLDGKLTVVIEDAAGRRVRNLAAGQPAARGPQRIEWDGCDEDGRLVKEGQYRWRSIHHPGIVPEFVMNFCNADEPGFRSLLSNHCHFEAAAANTGRVVLAAVGTEGGFAMAAFDRAGRWRQGYNPILGAGWNAVAVALDDKYLYAAHDGEGWGMRIDKTKTNWTAEVTLTLTRFDLESGSVVDYAGGRRWSALESHTWGAGATNPALRDAMSLSGMALLDGRLYLGSRLAQGLLVVEAATGALVDTLPLPQPGAVAAGGGRLVAMSGRRPMLIDVATRAARPLFTPEHERALGLEAMAIRALALGPEGRCYLADGLTHTVKAIDATGRVEVFGQPGGPYAGAWQAERMVAPSGLAVLGDRLWVAEDRTLPKRAVAWDIAGRKVVRQVFGNPAYGGPGAGFDPGDPTRWVGEGANWTLNFENGTATPTGILGWTATGPMHWRTLREAGRTYLLGMGMANVLTLRRDDGTLRPVAAWASAHTFSYAWNWNPPQGFVDAFTAAYPRQQYRLGTHGKPDHGPGVLWVDRNGDGAMQQLEFEFSGTERMAGSGWGHDMADLTIRLPVTAGGKAAVLTLRPDGVDANGVPRYPRLGDALAAAAPLRDLPTPAWTGLGCASSVSRAGDLILLSEPMTAWAPDGALRWRYPNPWSNVHGSHDAPLPQAGVLQGALFILGMAPLDTQHDAFVVNGNHGRFFVLTSDGLYLDEMFNDCRVAQTRDANLIGGECFGGVFGRSDDGTYWLQTGGDAFRLYRLKGLDRLQRARGELTVTPQHLLAAQRRAERRHAETRAPATARLQRLAAPPTAEAGSWPADAAITWAQQGGAYRVTARLGFDATNLYLRYDVADASPWVNNGTDWTLLFKTGDSVDLQLGTDPAADPGRKGPVPGDLRLLVAPMGTQTVAVLYRHRVPGTKQGMAFSSPWRTEAVDEVRRLDTAAIRVRKGGDTYQVDAVIPLAELGFAPRGPAAWKADLGVIYGDDAGTLNLLRNYWANQATGLINDVPGEIMLQPVLWGSLTMEAP